MYETFCDHIWNLREISVLVDLHTCMYSHGETVNLSVWAIGTVLGPTVGLDEIMGDARSIY